MPDFTVASVGRLIKELVATRGARLIEPPVDPERSVESPEKVARRLGRYSLVKYWQDHMAFDSASGLYVFPPRLDYYSLSYPTGWLSTAFQKVDAPETVEPEFEVDLVEPLCGWKTLDFDEKSGMLASNYNDATWPFCAPFAAECGCGRDHRPPAVYGSCGVYALDAKIDPAECGSHDVIVELYGWGRYVRSDLGWRSEFAYPRAIYLRKTQAPLVKPLSRYRVPIFVDVPQCFYLPEEDGYEHRQEEAPRDSGANEAPDPEED